MNDLPLWAKVIATVGFPAAMSIWLLWLVTGAIADITALHVRIDSKIDQHAEATADVLPLLRAICRHTARNELQSQDCER